MRALEREPTKRFQSAREFAIELEGVGVLATSREVGEWVERVGGVELGRRARKVADIESASTLDVPHASPGRPETQAAEERSSRSPEPPEIVSAARPRFDEVSSGRSSVSGVSAASLAIDASPSQPPVAIVPSSDDGSWPRASSAPLRAKSPVRSGLAALIGSLGGGLLAYLIFAPAHELPPARAPIDPAESSIQLTGTRGPEQVAEDPPSTSLNEPGAPAAQATNAGEEPAKITPPPDSEKPAASSVAPSKLVAAESLHGRVPRPAVSASAAPEPSPSGRAAVDCSPPWTIDKAGIRRVKPECL
jgi:serine/threonine-protein kinase